VASFNLVRYRHHDQSIFLYAFDLIELNGDDLRPDPLEGRKASLEMILAKAGPGIRFNEHMEGDGETVFRQACQLGFEGIVSKRLGSPYVSGRSRYWGQEQESGSTGSEAGSRRGLGPGSMAIKETAKTLLVVAVLAVLAAATVFMMVELWQSASQMREGRRGEWPSGPAP
jgi:hypothetical protein